MKENIVKSKSFAFAIRIIKLYQYLVSEKKEFVMSKQVLRSGTSVGAMIRESEYSESRADFIHKISIAQKEINESMYWLELLNETSFIEQSHFEDLHTDAVEIIKIITSILKTSKN